MSTNIKLIITTVVILVGVAIYTGNLRTEIKQLKNQQVNAGMANVLVFKHPQTGEQIMLDGLQIVSALNILASTTDGLKTRDKEFVDKWNKVMIELEDNGVLKQYEIP